MALETTQANIPFQRSSTRSFTEINPSSVLLVVLNHKGSSKLNHDILYQLFSNYGKILRILIFENQMKGKAFVEFDNLRSALEARASLDEFQILSDGSKLNVYQSEIQTIRFDANNADGIDYTREYALNSYFQQLSQFTQRISSKRPTQINTKNSNKQKATIIVENQVQSPSINQNNQHGIAYDDKSTSAGSYHSYQNRKEDDDQLRVISENQLSKIQQQQLLQQQQLQNINTTPSSSSRNKKNSLGSEELKRALQRPINENLEDEEFKDYFQNPYNPSPAQVKPKEDIMSPWTPSLDTNHNLVPHGYGNKNRFPAFQNPTSNEQQLQQNQALQNEIYKQKLISNKIQNRMESLPNLPSAQSPYLYKAGTCEELTYKNQPQGITSLNSASSITEFGNGSNNNNNNNKYAPQNQSATLKSTSNQLKQGEQVRKQPLTQFLSQPEIQVPFSAEIKSKNSQNSKFKNGEDDTQINIQEISKNLSKDELLQMHKNLAKVLDKKSPVLHVGGLEDPKIKPSMINAIFSNFGNITQVLFLKNKFTAFIEFTTVDGAQTAKEQLNNIVFLGKPMKINYSEHDKIKIPSQSQKKVLNLQSLINSKDSFRFKEKKPMSINPPSNVLHVSNLVKSICSDKSILHTHFSQYVTVVEMKFIFKENNRNMCLVQLHSVEEALKAMAHLHNLELGGRKIQISFTRSTLS